MKLTVIIPYYNGEKFISRCINSLEDYPKENVLLVDNSETELALKLPATIIKTKIPKLGFAKAVNIGLEAAYKDSACTHILILNQDAYFQEGHFKNMLQNLSQYSKYYENRNSLERFASPMIYTENFEQLMPFMKARYFTDPIPTQPFDIADFVAVALLAPTNLLQRLNGFDESYYMYYEDNDLIARSKIKNAVTIFPDIHVAHHNPELEGAKMSAEKNRWIRKSRIKYLWRHGSKREWLVEKLKWEVKKYWS